MKSENWPSIHPQQPRESQNIEANSKSITDIDQRLKAILKVALHGKDNINDVANGLTDVTQALPYSLKWWIN